MKIKNMPYFNDNSLLLEEILLDLRNRNIDTTDILFRASEVADLDRIQDYGTDRGGYPRGKIWRHSEKHNRQIQHEDIVFATTENDIISGEENPNINTSFKKFDIISEPLLIIYKKSNFTQMEKTEYLFNDPKNKFKALIAIYKINKYSEIQGWFGYKDGLFYRSLVKNILLGQIVEVGSWKGRSTSYIGKICNLNKTKLTCIDAFNGSDDNFNSGYLELMKDENIKETFINNMKLANIETNLIDKKSNIAIKEFGDNSLDLVFIDSSHDYNSVKKEICQWYKKVKKGAILSGHDFCEKHIGVVNAVKEFCLDNQIELFKGGYSIWYFIK